MNGPLELPAAAVITRAGRTRQGLVALFTAEGFLFSVDEDTYYQYGLPQAIKNGSLLSGGELRLLADKSEHAHARAAALRLVSGRMYARRELARKLAQKYDGPAVDWAVEEMERLGYLDDEAFARTRAGMLLRKNRSRLVILQDLADKGVDRQLAKTVLEELCSEEQEGDAAALDRLLEGQYARRLAAGDTDKVRAALARRGFGCGQVRRALERWQARRDFE